MRRSSNSANSRPTRTRFSEELETESATTALTEARSSRPVIPRLAMARLRVTLECLGCGELPEFLGSMLRGAFGHALKRVACPLPRPCRQECRRPGQCVYSYFFETPIPRELRGRLGSQYAPHPFVICSLDDGGVQCAPGDRIGLTMTLFGRGIRYFADLLATLEAVGEGGLGYPRIRFRVHSVADSLSGRETALFEPSSRTVLTSPRVVDLRAGAALSSGMEDRRHRMILRYLTPTHLVSQGQPVETVDLPVLLARLHQRLESLTLLHGDGPVAWDETTPPAPARLQFDSEPPPPGAWAGLALQGGIRLGDSPGLTGLAKEARVVDGDLYWVTWERRSNRQGRRVPLSGLLGEVLVENVPGVCVSWLRAGQWVHVGKSTAFGMGLYEVEVLKDVESG